MEGARGLSHREGSVSPARWVPTPRRASPGRSAARGSQSHFPGWAGPGSCHQEIFPLTDGPVPLAPCCCSGKTETVHKGERVDWGIGKKKKKKGDFDGRGHNIFFLLSKWQPLGLFMLFLRCFPYSCFLRSLLSILT